MIDNDIILYTVFELYAMLRRWKSRGWKNGIPFTRSEIEAELRRRDVSLLEPDEDDKIVD